MSIDGNVARFFSLNLVGKIIMTLKGFITLDLGDGSSLRLLGTGCCTGF